jgi:uncharacterized membrane protein (UPF0127 family)
MFGKSREVYVYNQTKGTFLAFRVNVADSILGRLIGLLGRRSLKPDGGVWIVPANSIHTVGMLFSFDAVMIDKDFRVVSVTEMVKPFRVILPKRRAESVLELPAHAIFRSRTEVGDQLVIERYEAKKVAKPQLLTRPEQVAAPASLIAVDRVEKPAVLPSVASHRPSGQVDRPVQAGNG